MKYVSFRAGAGTGFGVVVDNQVAVLGEQGGSGKDLVRCLAGEPPTESEIADAPRRPLDGLAFAPVIPEPGLIYCVGMNYAKHVAEMGRDPPKYPAIFSRLARSQVGHEEAMVLPSVSSQFDYEGELAVVIGRGGRYIKAADALNHVAGYSCYNDGSLRDFQRHTIQFTPGKNFWGTGAFGPYLVTPDEFGDASEHHLTTRLNGETVQTAPVSDLIFDVADLIAYISSFTELRCGDVIVTGTPGGVGVARNPQVFMKPGDIVEVEIDGLGILRNPVVAESDVSVPGFAKRPA